ncbi:MAG: Mannose-6-phosphate isomerase, cupin superfamily [Chloroflexi bacterium]|jgi:mannose-6-phosphate isomerase-like protein (cupin superfamily)|nr:MAG: Mannose-6-phosphate isomerase, cupin superfamily [Chloroflexota bacterium]
MAEDLHYSGYESWVEKEGLPVYGGWGIHPPDLQLAPWDRMGANAALLHLEARGDTCTDIVLEIGAGASTKPVKHMYEELVYVLSGRGATSVWLDESRKNTFEWQPGSLFGIPLNATYQHFNGSGDEPARFVSVTNLPLMLNMFHNEDYIWNSNFQFKDRLGDESYFLGEGIMHDVAPGKHWWETNLLADAPNFELRPMEKRGAGGINLQFNLANASMHTHISQFPVGTYKKAHGHAPGAHIVLLSGVGFSLIWPDGKNWVGNGGGFDERVMVPWKPGGIFVPMGYHQHFNTGPEPARYLAMGFGGYRYHIGAMANGTREDAAGGDKSVQEGGIQIEYEDEDPRILPLFEEECVKNGSASKMREFLGKA